MMGYPRHLLKKNIPTSTTGTGSGTSHDFLHKDKFTPTQQDVATKAKFDQQEQSFDKPAPKFDLSVLNNNPNNPHQVLHDQLKAIFPNIDKHTPSKSAGEILGNYGKGFVGAFNSKLGDLTNSVGNLVKHSSLDPTTKIIYGDALDKTTNYLKNTEKANLLPNNIVGNIVSGLGKTVPTALGAYATGGASLEPEGAALTGSYLSNSQIVQQGLNEALSPVSKYMTAEGALTGAGAAAKDNKNVLAGAIKGGEEGLEQGILLHGSMKSGDFLGSKAFDLAKKSGIVDESGKFTEQALKSIVGTPVSFSTASVADDIAHGRTVDWNKSLVQGASALPFETSNLIESARTNKVVNFLSATPEDINRVSDSKVTAPELEIGSIKAGMDAENSEDKNTLKLKQLALKHDADIKENVDAILKDKDGYIQSVQESNLPDEVKQQITDKVNQTYKDNDPVEKQKTQLGSQAEQNLARIKEIDETDPTDYVHTLELKQEKANLEEENKHIDKQITDLIKQQNETENERARRQPTETQESNSTEESVGQPERPVQIGREDDEEVLNQGGDEPPLQKEENEKDTKAEGKKESEAQTNEGKEEPRPDSEGDEVGKDVKKTILTKRAYEGDIQPEVKKHLEEKGLTRKSYSPQERSEQATDFIKKFGDDAAHMAVKNGDVRGGLATSILAQLQIKNNRLMADLPEGSPEREALSKQNAELINTSETEGYFSGEFVGQLAHEYQSAELDYANIKRQVEKSTGKSTTPAQEKKIKELSDQNDKLQKQVKEAEAKLIEETDKAFESGKQSVKEETKAQKAKRIADKVRQSKLSRPGVFSAATPGSLVWDGAVEVVAKSIEAGGKLADAIDDGLKHIRDSDWYKSLSDTKKKQAEDEFRASHHESAGSTDLADLQERFLNKSDNKFTPAQAKDLWGYMKENYISNGVSYRDAIAKTAQDLGLSWRQVSEAVVTPKTKRTSDEMWKKQYDLNRARVGTKGWIDDQNQTKAGKALKEISGLFRGIAVYGHGGIFVGTHAGMNLFNPTTWNKTIPAFLNGWKFAYGNEANYQRAMEELKNSPNYVTAQRAGLKNDPDRINAEEYQKSQKYLEKLAPLGRVGRAIAHGAEAGEKGFNAIKVLRQGLFDYHFNKLSPAEQQDPESAKSIAKIVNLATGATNLNIPKWVNEVSFAGGMEAARWEKLTANPVKATRTAIKALTNPQSATTAEKVFAKVWASRVGEQVATYSTALLANAAIQSYLNPKNPVNLTNPDKPDFLEFKSPIGGIAVDPTSGMRGTTQFIYQIGKIPFEQQKELRGEDRVKLLSKKVGQHAKGKLAPFYSTLAEVYSGRDFNGNVLPWSKEKPASYAHKLTPVEYGTQKLPLPIAEAFDVFYKSAHEHGGSSKLTDNIIKAIISGGISGSTGFRVHEDEPKKKK